MKSFNQKKTRHRLARNGRQSKSMHHVSPRGRLLRMSQAHGGCPCCHTDIRNEKGWTSYCDYRLIGKTSERKLLVYISTETANSNQSPETINQTGHPKSRVRRISITRDTQNTAKLRVSYKLGPRWDDVITWSDFKSETSFGFLSPNYAGNVLVFFCKAWKRSRLTSFHRRHSYVDFFMTAIETTFTIIDCISDYHFHIDSSESYPTSVY